jgi:hypothetical protein
MSDDDNKDDLDIPEVRKACISLKNMKKRKNTLEGSVEQESSSQQQK